MTDDLDRVVIHEAAHLAMAFVLGAQVGAASVRRCDAHNGVAFFHARSRPSTEMLAAHIGKPVPLLPTQIRRWAETSVMFYLAGDEATRFWHAGYIAETERDEKAAAENVHLLTRPEREALAKHTKGPNDQDKAWALAFALAGDGDSSTFYMAWLRRETREVIWGPRCQRLIGALAPVLKTAEELSGRAVTQVLREADAALTYFTPNWQVAASD
jgi:hypothetical protein